ncbi:MAG: hypothetical protein MJ229_04335 [bacterium]|nr:hypothetical protein [bacterium]
MNWFAKVMTQLARKERVQILTEDYEIEGWLYNPGFSTRRFLSDLLNGANKNFIAVTDCYITYNKKDGKIEHLDFLQLNIKYVVLIKPIETTECKTNDNI